MHQINRIGMTSEAGLYSAKPILTLNCVAGCQQVVIGQHERKAGGSVAGLKVVAFDCCLVVLYNPAFLAVVSSPNLPLRFAMLIGWIFFSLPSLHCRHVKYKGNKTVDSHTCIIYT